MIRTLRAFLLAGFVACSGLVWGQDPVTERPGATRPADSVTRPSEQAKLQPQQNAQNAVKPLVTLEGNEEWGNNGSLIFHVYQSGKAVMIDATQKPVSGTVKVDGNRMTLTFGNCVYEGTEVNNVISGRARYTSGNNAGRSWAFRLTVRNPLLGRTYAGQETLGQYGNVSFRFVDGRTVEMHDRDGLTRGTYAQNGLRVNMTFGNAHYEGDIRGDSIAGSARNGVQTWTFQTSVK
jgi:hypothetical protein